MKDSRNYCAEKERITLESISGGGMGGDLVAVDSKDGKIVRIRPLHRDYKYSIAELEESFWELKVGDKSLRPSMKSSPNYFALAYKNRVYSKNRVRYPLKRVDWEPGGDPAKINAKNRGRSKFKRISWDEALDIMEAEIRRVIETYGATSVFCIGENGHHESKCLHTVGGQHMTVMRALGGYTREVRTPDSVEGWYWGAKHFWGAGSYLGLGMPAMPQQGFMSWNVVEDITANSEMIAFDAGDYELTQNYASQYWSRLLRFWEELGKEFVIVDPFCNYTAVCHPTMKWIPILPNTDAAMDFGIIHTWITEGLYDKDYVRSHSIGFDKVKAYVMGEEDGVVKDAAWAAERCGVAEWTIKAYARNTANLTTAMCHFSSGAIKGPYSHEPGRTAAYKLGMQGLGKPGIQQLYMNNSTIGKERIATDAGPFINMNRTLMYVPAKQQLPRTKVAEAIENGEVQWWGSPSIILATREDQFIERNYPQPAGVDEAALAVSIPGFIDTSNMSSASDVDGARVHMLWSEKPCNMTCWNGGFKFQDAIRSNEVEFFVTNHQWLENDSVFADLVLPVTTALEDDDIMGGSMIVSIRHASLTPRSVEPICESKSDYHIAIEVAKRFGIEEACTLGMTDDEAIKQAFDMSRLDEEISWEELSERGYYFPKQDETVKDIAPGMSLFFDDPDGYPLDTPSGKLEFYSQALADAFPDDLERQPIAKWIVGGPAEEGWSHDETLEGEKCKVYPLLMCSTAPKWRIHVQGDDIKWFREIETCKVRGWDGYDYEPIWLHPTDAKVRGIGDGDIVKVFNDQGIILTGAIISERVTPKSVVVNKCSRVDPIAPHIDRGGSTNLICPPGPISKHCIGFVVTGYLVEVQKLEREEYEQWRASYPETFNRDYDQAIGINYSSWVVE
ncbi:MAG: molybdopterin-dependent oxidoreductase [Coriobacteriales bacterium]|nr:molybdopterin-dependent oxidoreductase [Coriobacteriales bacterium]